MRFGSVCSGIEAASIAWEPIGWAADWVAEIEPFPSAVLKHNYPGVPNLGDMTTIKKKILLGEVSAPDLLVGGTPCQAFSIAGLRASMDDERGQLTLEFVRIINAIDHVRIRDGRQETIAVWENVPGALSTKDNAFGCFLAALVGEQEPLKPTGERWSDAGCVYGPERTAAWRVLDAQYFGLAQRRKRVFVVASARKGFDPGSVLFESEGVRRDTAPSRETKPPVTALTANGAGHENVIAFAENSRGELRLEGGDGQTVGALSTGGGKPGQGYPAIVNSMRVRKLTPTECERLQGFPDGCTQVPYRNKPAEQCPDGPRYKALGNSMAVPVMRWIGERIHNEASRL